MRRDLAKLEALLEEEHPPLTLHRLVAWEGNWPQDEAPDEAAAAFLRQLADLLRGALADRA